MRAAPNSKDIWVLMATPSLFILYLILAAHDQRMNEAVERKGEEIPSFPIPPINPSKYFMGDGGKE